MDQYLGEIRMFAGDYAPESMRYQEWALCDGRLMDLQENAMLYTLIGTTYGGDGVKNFALPNLQSRVPIHIGEGDHLLPIEIGQMGGAEHVNLRPENLPPHSHEVIAMDKTGNTTSPEHAYLANSASRDIYAAPTSLTSAMNKATVSVEGKNENMSIVQPSIVINYIIAIMGEYPYPIEP